MIDLVPTLCVGTLFLTLRVGAVDHNNGFGKARQRLKPTPATENMLKHVTDIT